MGNNKHTPYKCGAQRYAQKGASLLVVLLLVGVLGPFFTYLLILAQQDPRKAEASATAEELAIIARGARLSVRDDFAADPANFRTISAVPTALAFNTLQNRGYIPRLLNRFDAGNPVTPLTQPITIVRVNWVRDQLGAPVPTADDIPTAFVVIGPSPKIDTLTGHVLASRAIEQALQKANIQVRAPIFDIATNTNISPDCRGGGPAVALWDTGCLTNAEYTTLRTSVPTLPAFAAGTLIIPVWKTANLDSRAVMRFPQPENAGYATMLTDLTMARSPQLTNPLNPDTCANTVGFNRLVDTPQGPVPQNNAVTDLCAVDNDNGADNRFNIRDAGTLTADRIIAEPQTGPEAGVVEAPTFGSANDTVLNITGRTTLNQDIVVLGRTPSGVAAMPAGVTSGSNEDARIFVSGDVAADNNMIANTESATQGAIADVGGLSNRQLVAKNITANTLNTSAGTAMNVANSVTTTNMTNTAGNGLAAENINIATVPLNVNNQADVTNNLTVGLTGSNLNGGLKAGTVNSGADIQATSATTISSSSAAVTEASITVTNSANISGNIDAPTRCIEENTVTGACPNRNIIPGTITP